MASQLLRLVVCAMVLRDMTSAHVILQTNTAQPSSAEKESFPEARSSSSPPSSLESLRSCWVEDGGGCKEAVNGLLDHSGDIHLADFAVLEATNASSTDDASNSKDDDKEEGRASGVEMALRHVGRLLKKRALKINLWDVAEVGARVAPEKPDSLEITIDTVENEGRGVKRSTKRMSKVIIPLLLGFKVTGALILGITVVKMFLVKAFVVSKLALLAALFMMIRKLLSAVGAQHHPYLFSQHKVPAYSLDAGYPAAAASDYSYGYGATPYHGYYGGHYSTAGDYGHYAAAAAAAQEGAVAGGAGGDDLQGHFSTNTVSVQQAPGNGGTRNATKMVARTDGLKHAVYGVVKSSAHRIPVNTYRKLVSTGRKMAP